MRLYLIRHGESTANKEKAFQGWNDVHLNEKGKNQAKKLSQYFNKEKIQFFSIYSSPLTRAMETAEPLQNCSKHKKVMPVEGLKSINVGDWGGMLISRVKEEFSDDYSRWRNSPEEFCFPDGESLADVQSRAHTSLEKIINSLPTDDVNIALISHMITIKVIALTILGKKLSQVWDKEYTVPNTGIMVFDISRHNSQKNINFSRIYVQSSNPRL